jgi:hypothetical protein
MRKNRNVSKVMLSLWYPGLVVPIFLRGFDLVKTNVQTLVLAGIKPTAIVVGEYGLGGFRIIPFASLGITLGAIGATTRPNVRQGARRTQRAAAVATPVATGRARNKRQQRANHAQPTVN